MPASPDLEKLARQWLPRILTQIDRDPSSSTYGCADRNWWHYKIRDFPSIILQQAGYAVFLGASLPGWEAQRDRLYALAAGACRFWARQVGRSGRFDEYYPWEQGYPPLAFSTLAVMKLVHAGVVSAGEVEPAAARAADLLQRRFEAEAANQQAAGVAAMTWLRRVYPERVNRNTSDRIVNRLLELQHEEGWFPEYGGPDLGYLSVTVDCLWDAYDAAGESAFLGAAVRALRFIDRMTALTGASPGMHNARNTDYLVPYGMVRFAAEGTGEARELGIKLVRRLFGAVGPSHALTAIDDRYLCHYIGWSVLRACPMLGRLGPEVAEPAPVEDSMWTGHFPGSGHVVRRDAMVSLNKGGVVTLVSPRGETLTDFGWAFDWKGSRYVSHWWSDVWTVEPLADGWVVRGPMVPCREMISSPLKHVVLRVASRVFGARLIRLLKRRLIFRRHQSPYRFERRIHFGAAGVELEDRLTGLPPGLEPERAPRASRRHVASADSYHPEDLAVSGAEWERIETRERTEIAWCVLTRYRIRTPRPGMEEQTP